MYRRISRNFFNSFEGKVKIKIRYISLARNFVAGGKKKKKTIVRWKCRLKGQWLRTTAIEMAVVSHRIESPVTHTRRSAPSADWSLTRVK